LDAGRVEMELAPVDLNDLVDEHVGDRSPIAESRSQSLTGIKQPDLPLVVADRGLIGQALSVLLTNALNYTPPGGEITIRTETARRNGQPCVGFAVANTGPGIPPEDRDHLFERFFRGEAGRKSGSAGTGLGLAIAREIVSLHHGEIVVDEKQAPGQTVEFSVWLPLRSEHRNGNGIEK
jgi:signal transduction histidine kinase